MSSETVEPPVTGDERVDEALRGLSELAQLEVDEHAPRFDAVHEVLREVLNSPMRPSEPQS